MEEDKRLWVDDQYAIRCRDCNKKFTLLRRRHHCRQCGQIFCSSCLLSTTSTLIPYSDIVNEISKVVSKWTSASEKEAHSESTQHESHELERHAVEQPLSVVNERRITSNQPMSLSSLEKSHFREFQEIPLTTLSTFSPHYSSCSSSFSSSESSSWRSSIALSSQSPLSHYYHYNNNHNTSPTSHKNLSTSTTTVPTLKNKDSGNSEKCTNYYSSSTDKQLYSSNIKVCRRCAQSLLAAQDRQRSLQQEVSRLNTCVHDIHNNKWQKWHAYSASNKRSGVTVNISNNNHLMSNQCSSVQQEQSHCSSLLESIESLPHSTPHLRVNTSMREVSFAPVEQHGTDEYKKEEEEESEEEEECASFVCVNDDSVCNITKIEINVCQKTWNNTAKQYKENNKLEQNAMEAAKAFLYERETEEERSISYAIADTRMFILPFIHQQQEIQKECNATVPSKYKVIGKPQTKKELDACITADVELLWCNNNTHLTCTYLSAAFFTWLCSKVLTSSENLYKNDSFIDGSSNNSKMKDDTFNDNSADFEEHNVHLTSQQPNGVLNTYHQEKLNLERQHYYVEHLRKRIRQHCHIALQFFATLWEPTCDAESWVKNDTELHRHSSQTSLEEMFVNDIMEVACNVVRCIAVPLGSHIANHVKYVQQPLTNVPTQLSCSQKCRVVDGLVLCQGIASRRMPHVWHRPRILILSGEVTTPIEPAVELSEYIASYKGFLDKLYERICRWTPNIIVTERGMHHYLQECIVSNGHITLIMNVGATNLQQLAMCTDAMIISDLQYVTLEELGNEEMLGVCDVFEVCELSYESHLCIFRGLPCPLIATVLINNDKWKYYQYKEVLECAIMDTYHLCLQFHLMRALHLLTPPCLLIENCNDKNHLHDYHDSAAMSALLCENMCSKYERDTIMFTTVYLDKLNSASDGTAYPSYLQANSNCVSLFPASSAVSTLPHMKLTQNASNEFSHSSDVLAQKDVLYKQKNPQDTNESEKKQSEKEEEEDEPILPYMVSKQVNKLKFYTQQDESMFSFLAHQRGQHESRVLLAHDRWKITISTSTSVEVVSEGPITRSNIETTYESNKSTQRSGAHYDKETDVSCVSNQQEKMTKDMSKRFTWQYNLLRQLTLRYYRYKVANLNVNSNNINCENCQYNRRRSRIESNQVWWQPELFQVQRLQHFVSCHVECKVCKKNENTNVQNCKASLSTFTRSNNNLLSPHILNLSIGAFIHFLIYGLPQFVCAECKHKIELPFTIIFTIHAGTGSPTCTRVELAEIPRYTVVYPLSKYKKAKMQMESEVCTRNDNTVCDAEHEKINCSIVEVLNNMKIVKRHVSIRLQEPTSLIAAVLERYYSEQALIENEQQSTHTDTTKKEYSGNKLCNCTSNREEELIVNSEYCEKVNTDAQEQCNKMELVRTLENVQEVDSASAQIKTVSYTLRLSKNCVVDNVIISGNNVNDVERDVEPSQSKPVAIKVDMHLVNEFSALQQLYCADSSNHLYKNSNSISSNNQHRNMKREKSTLENVKLLIESLERCRSFKAEGGKTKAEFYVTLDKHFLLKRVKHMELRHFLRFAPRYFKYMSKMYHSNKVDAQETENEQDQKSVDESKKETTYSALTKIIGLYTIHYHSSVRSPNVKLLDTTTMIKEPAYVLSTEPYVKRQTSAVVCEAAQNKDVNKNKNNTNNKKVNLTEFVQVTDTNITEENSVKGHKNNSREKTDNINEFTFTVNSNDDHENCNSSEEYNEHYHFILMQYLTSDETKEYNKQIEPDSSEANKINETATKEATNHIACYDLKGSQRNRTTNSTATVRQDVDLIHRLRQGNFFYISFDEKRKLMNVIKRDVELLATVAVMDYSLLAIVNKNTEKINVGIIDFLHPYTSAKVIESKVKSSLDTVLRYPAHDPTIIDPIHYRQRFLRWIDGYFCEVP